MFGKKSFKVFIVSLLFFVFSAGISLAAEQEIYEQFKTLTETLDIIQQNYVETVESKKLLDGAAKGMVGVLDPFSQYMEPEVYTEMKTETEGEFGGLGIRISIKDGILTVITPLPGTPAYRLGILPGDKIIKIEGESTQNLTVNDAVKKLRGAPGTKVTITIFREGEKEPMDIAIVREKIKIESIQSKMLESNIGYIRIIEFSQRTATDLEERLVELNKQGMKSLVLDLRNNPGGLLDVAVECVRKFLDESKLIVYTQGRNPEQKREYFAYKSADYAKLPMVILVNKGSASGSEIVAGALRDQKRAVIIGSQTFGKASVQSIFPISEGYALRLTTAKYYTPSGKPIHGVGITPDIVMNITPEIEIKLMAQSEMIYSKDKEAKPMAKKEDIIEDQILNRGMDLLKAREIFFSTVEQPKEQSK